MSNILRKIFSFCKSPIEKNLRFTLFLFLISTSVLVMNVLLNVSINMALAIFLFGFVQCYLLCMFIPAFGKWGYLYKVLLFIFASFSFIGDVLMAFVNEVRFILFGGVILGTNVSEAIEFIFSLVSYKDLIAIGVVIIVFYILWRCLSFLHPNKLIKIISGLMMLVSIPTTYINAKDWILHSTFMGKYVILISEAGKSNYDLKDYYANPQIYQKGHLPDEIIVVIGESFSRRFSSLYGYEKKTNPKLESISDSCLHIYKNVTSAFVITIPSLKSIMSTYSRRINEDEWYKCLTLPEVLHKLGYHTYWISNQYEGGIFDNITTKYAYLCDSTIFAGTRFAVNAGTHYDDVVLQHLKHISNISNQKKVVFIHLMGSHPEFQCRYPQNRMYYRAEDYSAYPKHQRENRAHYDNSLIYNDSVVNCIFKQVEQDEALCFYFSDHGLDIYQTKDDYAAHAIRSDSSSIKICQEIPFMIYTSPSYVKGNPLQMKLIESSLNTNFVTEDFMYSLMDIIGASFVDNDDVKNYSLFRKGNEITDIIKDREKRDD